MTLNLKLLAEFKSKTLGDALKIQTFSNRSKTKLILFYKRTNI